MGASRDIVLRDEPFCSTGIISMESYVKRGQGILWQNRSSCKLHYETSQKTLSEIIIPKAKQLKIPHRMYYPDGGKVHRLVQGENALVLVSGSTLDNFHGKVNFQELIRDACIPAARTIPKQDAVRRNSGPTVGLASSQGTTRCTINDAFAQPGFVDGTQRYSHIFGIIWETTKSLLVSLGLSSFLPPSPNKASSMQRFYNDRCASLSPGNMYLSLSFKVYLHRPDNEYNHKGHFNSHRDKMNPHYESSNDIFFTAWDTWFEPLLNLNVTGTIIACGRRSQEELYARMMKIGRASEEIFRRANRLPLSQTTITQEMLCPPETEFIVRGCHLLQIHALTPNEYIYALSKLLGGRVGLSAFLATEIILAFHQTSNNSLRFHRFMNNLIQSVEVNRDLRVLGTLTIIEAFQQYCYKIYGSFDGLANRQGVQEGAVRHQATSNCPVSHYANMLSLQSLVMALQVAENGTCVGARYKSLVANIKANVIGLGELKAQKSVATFASLGLYIHPAFLCFFSTGAGQQLKNLKDDPAFGGFARPDEVVQLRTHILSKQTQLLPMQADEHICTLSGKRNTSVGEVYYQKVSIFNAVREVTGRVGIYRFSYARKVNETAPRINFNYHVQGNHYVPAWVSCGKDQPPPCNAMVSLCSTVNSKHSNTCKLQSNTTLSFLQSRLITPGDFQPLLLNGHYVVVLNLLHEAAKYIGCDVAVLSSSIQMARAERGQGYAARVCLGRLSASASYTSRAGAEAFHDSFELAKSAMYLSLLLTVEVEGKEKWMTKFFTRDKKCSKGFLLLVPRSSDSDAFCSVVAFIYRQDNVTKCCILDKHGTADFPFTMENRIV